MSKCHDHDIRKRGKKRKRERGKERGREGGTGDLRNLLAGVKLSLVSERHDVIDLIFFFRGIRKEVEKESERRRRTIWCFRGMVLFIFTLLVHDMTGYIAQSSK